MTNDQTINLTIDGQAVRCPAGSTVYEAATQAGIHIPTFCHHKKLVPVGACRMCLVEIESVRGLQTSCSTPAREGMVVKVHTSPLAVKARRANIEFLLTNHPLDCPVCDKGGECPLQDQTLQDGPGQSRYVEAKRHKNKHYPLGELIVLDQERCVLCWRCIRYLDEWAGDHQLDLFGRGAATRLDTFPGRPLTSKWQGNTIDICPVGALTSRIFRFEARVWELCNTPSICLLCAVGCNIVLGEKNNELRRITPRENMEVNDAWICDKGRFTHAYVDHPDRLKTPLIRRDSDRSGGRNGGLEPATWDEALDLIARRLSQVIRDDGPQAVGGLGSPRVTNEANYLFQRFMRTVVGSNNLDHLRRMPAGATPLNSLPDLEQRDLIVLLGSDPGTEAPLVELWINKAVLRHDAQVLIANPVQIELGGHGGPLPSMTHWLGYRPGSEVALMNGLARAILDAGVADSRRQSTRVTNLDDLRSWLKPYSADRVEQMTGVPAAAVQDAARLLAQARRPILLYGPNWAYGPAAMANLDAMANLALLLGGIETGFLAEDNNTLGALEMGMVPDLYPGGQPFEDKQARSRLAGFWGGKLSPVKGLDLDGMLAAARAGDLKALWIIGADPAAGVPVAPALGRIPFLVVQDLFLTATASLADVVLPAASFAEADGTYINLTGRLQRTRAALRPPGQARPDWWIVAEVARRMVEGKRRKAWEFSGPEKVLDEISRVLSGYREVSYARLETGGWQRPAVPAVARRAFVRVESAPSPPDPDYPLLLVSPRLLYDRGTLLSRSERIQELVPAAYLLVHPLDASRLGLAGGEEVAVESASGRQALTVRVGAGIAPGVVAVPANLTVEPLSVLYPDRWTRPRVRIVK
jgi:NADH-quinone oxidoreductase subunit G